MSERRVAKAAVEKPISPRRLAGNGGREGGKGFGGGVGAGCGCGYGGGCGGRLGGGKGRGILGRERRELVGEAVAVLQADHGGEKEHEGDHGDDYGDRYEDVVGASHGRAGLAEEDEDDAEEAVAEGGGPGRCVTRVEFAESGGG